MTVGPRQFFGISDSASLFVANDVEPAMARQLVSLSKKTKPVICYVGAAKGDRQDRIAEFLALAERINAVPQVLSLFNPPTGDPSLFFAGVDIIFIDGGSTRNLMAIFQEWDVVDALRAAYDQGVIIAGASAGLNIMFDWSITDSVKSQLAPIRGYGFLGGSVCVHYDANPNRPISFRDFLNRDSATFPALAIDESVAVHFENERMKSTFAVRSTASLQKIEKQNNALVSSAVAVQRIG